MSRKLYIPVHRGGGGPKSAIDERKLLRHTIGAICGGKRPPNKLMEQDMSDALQAWCYDHVLLEWMTGLSIIEAAELMIEGALENGNLQVVEE